MVTLFTTHGHQGHIAHQVHSQEFTLNDIIISSLTAQFFFFLKTFMIEFLTLASPLINLRSCMNSLNVEVLPIFRGIITRFITDVVAWQIVPHKII